ncbi:hypothetical protein PAPHI01_2074 [Pancytospora philotis]|nr:hypothetical protein PAPHI01_2074 [Pancytospora philotis]
MLVRALVNMAATCHAQPGAGEENGMREESIHEILPDCAENWFTSNFDIRLVGVLEDEPTGDIYGHYKWDTIVAEVDLSEQLVLAGTVGGNISDSDTIQLSLEHPIHSVYRWCYLTLSPKEEAEILHSEEEIPCVGIVPSEMLYGSSNELALFKTRKGELGIYLKALEFEAGGAVLQLKRPKEPIIYTQLFYNQWNSKTQWAWRGLLQFSSTYEFQYTTMFELSTNDDSIYLNVFIDQSGSEF